MAREGATSSKLEPLTCSACGATVPLLHDAVIQRECQASDRRLTHVVTLCVPPAGWGRRPAMILRRLIIGATFIAACAHEDGRPAQPDAAGKDTHVDATRPCVDRPPVADLASAACYAGAAFLDCPGAASPALFCSDSDCKWISHGASVAPLTFKVAGDCTCEPQCPSGMTPALYRFIYERGTDPWTRERDRNVTATVGAVPPQSAHSITCSNCSGCSIGDNPCTAAPLTVVTRDLPGTYRVLLGTAGGVYGWLMEIEIDLQYLGQPAARVCRLPFTDALACKSGPDRLCAAAGTIKMSSLPTLATLKIALSVSVDFPDGAHIDAFVADK
jgi:hypothetical protein